ncbi:MAG: apolipoprotein N-acyltransferase [Gemmataceae bacterium]|nr:apolipoprotein N-acyltransferase [Gemmataceae bacterium]
MREQAVTALKGTSKAPCPAPADPDPAATPTPASAAVGPRPHLALPAVASAGLLYLCYFPVAWGWLAWVALVPLLCLVRARASRRRVFFAAYLGGLLFFWPVLQWMRVADYRMYYTWAMLATYCALYFPAAILIVRRLDRNTRLPLVVTFPAVWVALEFARSFLLTGFAWYYLGHAQHDYLALIQVADLGGAYTVSLLVAAVNVCVFEALYAWAGFRNLLNLPGKGETATPTAVRWLVVQAVVVAALVGAALGYGSYRLGENAFTPGPRLALLQSNLDQRIRNAAAVKDAPDSEEAQGKVFDHCYNLFLYSVDRRVQMARPDLVVWPETSFPVSRLEVADELPVNQVPEKRRGEVLNNHEVFSDFAKKKCEVDTLLGLTTFVTVDSKGNEIRYNSALLLRADGSTGGRYDKIHRVPFGEYVPFRDWFPWMDAFAPYESNYSIRPGERLTRLQAGKHRFGVVICFEDTDPFLARNYGVATADGPAVDFLVNISNDGWFDGSSEHDEHLAIARFRAVETRRSVARSVNMGISAMIDGNGRVLAPTHVVAIDKDGRVLQRVPSLTDRQYLRWVTVPKGASLTRQQHATDWRVFREIQEEVLASAPNVKLVWMVLPGERQAARDLDVSDWHLFKQVAGVFTDDIPLDGRTSLYSRWGDWLALICCGLVVLALIWIRVAKRFRPIPVGAA